MSSYLAAGVRTPFGRFRGTLRELRAFDLAVPSASLLARRFGPDAIDGCVFGNVLQAGGGQNLARQVAVAAGFSSSTYGLTLNDVCLSSMTAVRFAADRVAHEPASAWLVGGADSMSQGDVALPGRCATIVINDGLTCALEHAGHGTVADRDDARLGITRAEADTVALASFERAAAARERGFFDGELLPIAAPDTTLAVDEGWRETSAEALASLAPAFTPDGTVTAGNASQMSDGAAVGIVSGDRWLDEYGHAALARIDGIAHVAGPDGTLHDRPAMAAERLLASAGLTVDDIDLWEINEAFAGIVLAAQRRLAIDAAQVNVNGGAIAIGHPLAATGFRLVLTLARAMCERGVDHGVAAMCGGGGQGAAVLLVRDHRCTNRLDPAPDRPDAREMMT